MRVVFLGPPGSGKGTQAKLLGKRLSVPAISTGEILRDAVREGTPLGLKARAVMEAGDLVSDELMIGLIQERLSRPDAQNGFILDGFPRTVAQAEALEKLLAGNGKRLSAVINLLVPESTIVDRLRRRSAQEQRADDRPETIHERLRVYRERTEPLTDYYRQRQSLVDVDGVGSLEEVGDRIEGALEKVERAQGAA